MPTTLDKTMPAEPITKTRELKKVRGYVAPTETGTIRTVRSHEKLVEVDVKEKKDKTIPQETIPKIKGAATIEEAVAKISKLNKSVKEADFSKSTAAISKNVTTLYRGGVNTSKNMRIDSKDGLRSIFDELSGSLNDIGFINKYNLSAQATLAKITEPAYIESLASKMNAFEKRLGELGLESNRLDLFTVAIKDAESPNNHIFVSNNPLDFLSTHEFAGKITEKNAGVLASIHQDEMNDMIWYTANKLDGGGKTAAAVATFDPKSGKFYHHTESIAAGSDPKSVKAIDKMIKNKMQAKQTVQEGRTFADIEVGEIKAMIAEQLTNKMNEIEEEIKNGGDINNISDDFLNPSNEFFGDIYSHMIQQMNSSFERFSSKVKPKSLAYNSPLNQAVSQFGNAKATARSTAQSVIDEYKNRWNRIKSGYNPR